MSNQFIGGFYTKLFALLKKDDGYSLGQKLTQIEKTAKKRFYDMTDKELYESLEKSIAEDVNDSELTDQEFEDWSNNKNKNV
jgi:hypothetical protein